MKTTFDLFYPSAPTRAAGILCTSWMIVCWLGATAPCATPDSKVAVVQNGSSDWHVSLRPEHAPPERLAAQELVKYVEKISGVRLNVVKEPEAPAKAIRIDCDHGRLDGFDLTVNSDRISIHGHTPRGALYGTYQVLEDMGCRWYYVGELGEVVPKRTDVSLARGKSSQVASFPERSVMVAYPSYYEKFDEWIDFLTKSRINNIAIYGQSVTWWQANRAKYLPLLKERQTILEFGGHVLPSFIPRSLFAKHPDYFRMNKEGQRTPDHNFCTRSDGVDILKKNAEDFFRKLPEITYFHTWADDLKKGGWCHCPKCKHLPPEDQNMVAMNIVAESLAKANPKASLALLAYHDTEKVANVKPAANLFLFHAPRERCYRHAFDDPQCRRNREEYQDRWLALRKSFLDASPKTIHEFSYYTDALLDREMQPPQIDVIPADARYFRSVGVPVYQNLMVSFRDWHSPPLSLIVFAKAAWNADVDGDQVLEDFCRNYYGSNLTAAMVGYYQRLEEACNLLFDGDPIHGPYTDMTWPPLDPDMRKAKIADVKQARRIHKNLCMTLDAALDRAADPITTERVQRERDVCELHDLLLQLAHCQFEGRLLGFQFVAGGLDENEGRRAARLLSEGSETVEKIIAWIHRYPEEQKTLIGGWERYYASYSQIMNLLETQVQKKLSEAAPAN